ncbi:MAG: SDR family oxidoreductase [Alphaproteobacteria bacterium]|nr:SDR family oxidoreductase [Alphaproteobacteria bacterium]
MSELPVKGQSAELVIDVTADLLERFASYSGDRNPMHFDDSFARARGLGGRVAHGMSYAAFISTLIGQHLPGPGALWLSQSIRFLAPVEVGETVRLRAEVESVSQSARTVDLKLSADVKDRGAVMQGAATVMVPSTDASPLRSGRPSTQLRIDGGPVAFLFGGASALGRSVASRLAGEGWSVALFGRRGGDLTSLVNEMEEAGGGIGAASFTCDLTDSDSVAAACEDARKAFGVPSALFHCASAPLARSGILETDAATFDAHLAVQLHGTKAIVDACAGNMIEAGGGSLTFIGSSAARGAPPDGLSAYAAAKSAAASYIRSVALELGPKGLRANVLSPDFLETRLTNHVPDRTRKLAAAKSPLRRLATVDEVAAFAVFIAGPGAAYLNGEDILLDGGQKML